MEEINKATEYKGDMLLKKKVSLGLALSTLMTFLQTTHMSKTQ